MENNIDPNNPETWPQPQPPNTTIEFSDKTLTPEQQQQYLESIYYSQLYTKI